jgi:integrase
MVNGHINHNPAVSPDDRVALGLYVYRSGKTPIPAPSTTVVLRVVTDLVRQLTVYGTDSATPDSRARPDEAIAMEKAHIQKQLSIHSLRHSFATHLLENGTNIKYIQELLGHASVRTTERYLHVARRHVLKIKSPLDTLAADE